MQRCKGKVMVSINGHPDITDVFDGFWTEGLEIKYSTRKQPGTDDHQLIAGGDGWVVLKAKIKGANVAMLVDEIIHVSPC